MKKGPEGPFHCFSNPPTVSRLRKGIRTVQPTTTALERGTTMVQKNQPEPGFLVSEHSLERLPNPDLSKSLRVSATQPATPAAQPMVACGSALLEVVS